MTWILLGIGALVVFGIAQAIHLSVVMTSTDQQTTGVGYYGRPLDERRAFKAKLRRHAAALSPILWLLGRTSKLPFDKASFVERGLPGPRGTCSEESFASALDYEPQPEDVFVVTQMKCGTTWMQHVVYQILHRGDGDLVESGTALYAVSPWIEGRTSASVDEAPLLGDERPSRLIKTHLPVSHFPPRPASKYIYVSRHPASCFASCADFIRSNSGPIEPREEDLEAWFMSDAMWWGPWPSHVAGWYDASKKNDNVLFVRFEDMKQDLPSIIREVAAHLGVQELTDAEIDEIAMTCSFEYMREHKDVFEMHPPHLLSVDGPMFVRGTSDRHGDLRDELRNRIVDWCRSEMAESGVPYDSIYPESEG